MSRGRQYSDEERARALELYRTDGLAAAHKATGVPKGTIRGWARRAGVTHGDARATAKTADATAERLRIRDLERAELADRIRRDLTRPAVQQLADLLDRNRRVTPLLDEAMERLTDAWKLERMAVDLDPREAEAARKRTAAVAAEVKVMLDAVLNPRELVGIITRSVTDQLALDGVDVEDTTAGEVTVTFAMGPPPVEPTPPGRSVLEDSSNGKGK